MITMTQCLGGCPFSQDVNRQPQLSKRTMVRHKKHDETKRRLPPRFRRGAMHIFRVTVRNTLVLLM